MSRPTGSKNKRTSELFDRVSKKFPGVCPVEKMIELGLNEIRLLQDGEVVSMQELKQAIEIAEVEGDSREYYNLLNKIEKSKHFALSCMKEAAPYLQSKLKSIEIEQNTDDGRPRAGVVLKPIQEAEWEQIAKQSAEELDKIALERIGEKEKPKIARELMNE